MSAPVFTRTADQNERLARFMQNCRREALRNSINRRFDRCCHPSKPGDGDLFFRRMFREQAS